MSTLRIIATSATLLAVATSFAIAQPAEPSSEGKEFWLTFQKNFRDFVTNNQTQTPRPAEPLTLELSITSRQKAHGYVKIAGLGFDKVFTVQPGKVTSIAIDTAAQIRYSDAVSMLAIHIQADAPISVFGLNRRYQTTDTYAAIPVASLGTEYRAVGYRWLENDLLSQAQIVGTENSTTVTILPTCSIQRLGPGHPAGVPYTITLNFGEVYQMIAKFDPAGTSDLTGTSIKASKPVAVFSGHNCAYVPDLKTKACNILVEQLPPVSTWGRSFVVEKLQSRSSYVVRVIAGSDGTEIRMNGALVATLKAGEFYENADMQRSARISCNNPAMVLLFSKGFDNSDNDNIGDPMMIVVPPVEQFTTRYSFATPVKGPWHHYVNIVAASASLVELQVDGSSVDGTKFHRVDDIYSAGTIELSYGTHMLEGAGPFGVTTYGFGYDDASYDAYGNGGGQAYRNLSGEGR